MPTQCENKQDQLSNALLGLNSWCPTTHFGSSRLCQLKTKLHGYLCSFNRHVNKNPATMLFPFHTGNIWKGLSFYYSPVQNKSKQIMHNSFPKISKIMGLSSIKDKIFGRQMDVNIYEGNKNSNFLKNYVSLYKYGRSTGCNFIHHDTITYQHLLVL